MSELFSYQKPENTYTIDQFIACQSDESMCYNNLSFRDKVGNIDYNTYNVLSDYIDEIRDEYCKTVTLSDDEMLKYKYRPKLLCYDVYGNGELAFIILIINDMYTFKDFTKETLLMPTKDDMNNITKYMFNSNRDDLDIYNSKNSN